MQSNSTGRPCSSRMLPRCRSPWQRRAKPAAERCASSGAWRSSSASVSAIITSTRAWSSAATWRSSPALEPMVQLSAVSPPAGRKGAAAWNPAMVRPSNSASAPSTRSGQADSTAPSSKRRISSR